MCDGAYGLHIVAAVVVSCSVDPLGQAWYRLHIPPATRRMSSGTAKLERPLAELSAGFVGKAYRVRSIAFGF